MQFKGACQQKMKKALEVWQTFSVGRFTVFRQKELTGGDAVNTAIEMTERAEKERRYIESGMSA
jgi:hypothetical protein